MKNTGLFVIVACGFTLSCACAGEPAAATNHPPQIDDATGMILPDATLTPRLEKWMDTTYGGIVCFGMNTFTKTEQVPVPPPVATYSPPPSLAQNVETWARTFKDAGMTYAVMLSQHTSGFCLWDSKVMYHGKEWSYDVGAASNRTDVVEMFVKACKKYGVEPGIYYCLMESYGDPTVRNPAGMAGFNWLNHRLPDDVFAMAMGQIGELADNQPDNHFFWIDIPQDASRKQLAEIYTLLRKKNPQNVIQFNSHYGWDHNNQIPKPAPGTPLMEAYIYDWPCDFLNSEAQYCFGSSPLDPIQKYHGKTLVVGYEHNETVGKDIWFTQPTLRSLDELMTIYAATRRRMPYGSRFLLNAGANADGSLDPKVVTLLMQLKPKIEAFDKEFGDKIKASKANLLQRLAH